MSEQWERSVKSAEIFRGTSGLSKAWLTALLRPRRQPALVITSTTKQAEEIATDLNFFLGEQSVAMYPGFEALPFERVSPAIDTSATRLRTIHRLANVSGTVAVTSVDSLMHKILDRQSRSALRFTLEAGEILSAAELVSRLERAGFVHLPVVSDLGEYAMRGTVVDFFCSTNSIPVRVEFSAGRVSQIKGFDPESQRSFSNLEQVEILPVRELDFSGDLSKRIASLKERAEALEVPPRELNELLEQIRTKTPFQGAELLQYVGGTGTEDLFSAIPDITEVFLIDREAIFRAAEEYEALAIERYERIVKDHVLVPFVTEAFVSAASLQKSLSLYQTRRLDDVDIRKGDEKKIKSLALTVTSHTELTTQIRTKVGSGQALEHLRNYLDKLRRERHHVAFVVGAISRAERLSELLLSVNVDAPILPGTGINWIESPRRAPVVILIGEISEGCNISEARLSFVAEQEIFVERTKKSKAPRRVSVKRLLNSLSALHEDDFVVHSDYGVGRYRGLKHLTVEEAIGDFLHIDYADSTLYLPVQHIGKVQKFVAAEGQEPALDKLSSQRWVQTKQRIRESVVTLAGDLIKLYATRKASRGWVFDTSSAEDERFAETFPYQETPDQQKAINDTLKDMTSERPMDRLVCGDVGFGKTEVAVRAAFKCLQHARQVAVLVPTTILVEQHFRTFETRLAGFPFKIAAVSRFYGKKQNQETLERLACGELDIVIGTHRLIQHDVHFKDLGLLIIDEEHRFGVKQKERLKQMRANVDVLTLTATPIPRTLHMSLLGIRDVSLISTPPVDRRTIQTYVMEKSDSVIRDAIIRELRRGGQIFFLHNRVQSIDIVAAGLSELVPEARFAVAHGQMHESEIEKVMKRFIDKEVDVLISTTIIESGLDIPNANTIIIDRADALGLAQLYQLRGRVGRSSRQAYAYLLVNNPKKLSKEAHKRLKVLQSLDDLGIGFNLAIRDLEIRGAGNLLGKEQSGSVLAVGFEMYCRIVEEAVAQLRGEEPALEDTIDPDLKISEIDAFIPAGYIPDIGERLVMYQRLANVRSDVEANDLRAEMIDRFGPLGEETENLIEIMRLRSLLRSYGVIKAEASRQKISLTFLPQAVRGDSVKEHRNQRIDGLKAVQLVKSDSRRYRFSKNLALLALREDQEKWSVPGLYREIHDILENIAVSPTLANLSFNQ